MAGRKVTTKAKYTLKPEPGKSLRQAEFIRKLGRQGVLWAVWQVRVVLLDTVELRAKAAD